MALSNRRLSRISKVIGEEMPKWTNHRAALEYIIQPDYWWFARRPQWGSEQWNLHPLGITLFLCKRFLLFLTPKMADVKTTKTESNLGSDWCGTARYVILVWIGRPIPSWKSEMRAIKANTRSIWVISLYLYSLCKNQESKSTVYWNLSLKQKENVAISQRSVDFQRPIYERWIICLTSNPLSFIPFRPVCFAFWSGQI